MSPQSIDGARASAPTISLMLAQARARNLPVACRAAASSSRAPLERVSRCLSTHHRERVRRAYPFSRPESLVRPSREVRPPPRASLPGRESRGPTMEPCLDLECVCDEAVLSPPTRRQGDALADALTRSPSSSTAPSSAAMGTDEKVRRSTSHASDTVVGEATDIKKQKEVDALLSNPLACVVLPHFLGVGPLAACARADPPSCSHSYAAVRRTTSCAATSTSGSCAPASRTSASSCSRRRSSAAIATTLSSCRSSPRRTRTSCATRRCAARRCEGAYGR